MSLKFGAGIKRCVCYGTQDILKKLTVSEVIYKICWKRIISYFGHYAWRNVENLEKLIIIGTLEETGFQNIVRSRLFNLVRDWEYRKWSRPSQMSKMRNKMSTNNKIMGKIDYDSWAISYWNSLEMYYEQL